jgi:uncharacterized membrane protein
MPAKWEKLLERWVAAGFIDAISAQRIAAYEAQNQKTAGLRWPVLIAVSFGGLLLGAGVLLFVAAHWDILSPTLRFSLVLLMVAGFHCGAALVAARFIDLATTLHALGTISLGAGIFLAGQIFNLQEYWPEGLMLWALGAWLAWAVLRDWVEATLVAILTPLWLAAEWLVFMDFAPASHLALAESLLVLALTYLSARTDSLDNHPRRALTWLGGLALIPCTLAVLAASSPSARGLSGTTTTARLAAGWLLGMLLPLALACVLRRRAARWNLLATLWVVALGAVGHNMTASYVWHELGLYLWCVVGSVGLAAWGLLERRSERINLGVAGVALTVLVFYFSSVMDKIDRATSLVGLGALFLAGGWILERTRRRLVARVSRETA